MRAITCDGHRKQVSCGRFATRVAGLRSTRWLGTGSQNFGFLFVLKLGGDCVSRTLRKAMELPGEIHVESNLSANSICDVIRRMLGEFGIPEDRMQIYLRQDRDAGRGST